MDEAARTCTREGCGRPHCARGLCRSHYVVAHRNGTISQYKPARTPPQDEAQRFFSKVDTTAPCWQWTGGVNSRGYGRFTRAPGNTNRCVYAHRWVWEYLVGPVPDGLTLDHLCRNTRCVNPDHLEPVTAAENSRRLGKQIWCADGRHRLDETAYVRSNGHRFCSECSRERNREWCRTNRPAKQTATTRA